MARNAEKSMAVLNRWLSIKQNIAKVAVVRRPRDTNECTDLIEAEKWRGQVIREISKKITEIQNASLGEHVIRDLNDQINRLLKEKYRWELRITELGGCDYRLQHHSAGPASHSYDSMALELSSQSGYKYFGAAKDLPGVREVFTKEVAPPPKRNRQQLYQHITPDYYGWRDEDDGDLIREEQQKENENLKLEREEYEKEIRRNIDKISNVISHGEKKTIDKNQDDLKLESATKIEVDNLSGNLVYVQSMEDIERLIIQKKKQKLLEIYASADLQQKENEAKELIGLKTDQS